MKSRNVKKQHTAGLGNVEEARHLLNASCAANPRNAGSWVAWAQLEERRGLGLERARELYEVARKAHRSNTRVFTAWAAAEARAGNATGATKLLAMATRAGGLSPGGCRDGNVYATLGDVLQRDLLDCDRAADAFRAKEDYAACSCAIQNFCISLAGEDVASKWSTGALTRDLRAWSIFGVDPGQEEVIGFLWAGYADPTPPVQRPPLSGVVRSIP